MRPIRIVPSELELLSLAFMANGAKSGLTSLLAGNSELSTYQIESLRTAGKLLTEATSGADFIENDRIPEGFNSIHALTALDYVLRIRNSVEALVCGTDIINYLSSLAETVTKAADRKITVVDQQAISEAVQFFEPFYRWVNGKLNSCYPVFGSRYHNSRMCGMP